MSKKLTKLMLMKMKQTKQLISLSIIKRKTRMETLQYMQARVQKKLKSTRI